MRRLVQIKVDDWLPKDSPFNDIYRSCERLNRTPQVEKRSKDAVCYSFLPAAGGAGNTTLAIQTAFMLGRAQQMENTCLVDLNFQDGAIADYLDIAPSFRIEELANAPGRLDRQLLEVMLTRHSSGLSVLATPRVPAKTFEISEGLIGAVLGLLSRSFDNVVIDLPKNWHPWMDNVIWGSNQVYVVTHFNVPALRHARYVVDAIAAKSGRARPDLGDRQQIPQQDVRPVAQEKRRRNVAARLAGRLRSRKPGSGRGSDQSWCSGC